MTRFGDSYPLARSDSRTQNSTHGAAGRLFLDKKLGLCFCFCGGTSRMRSTGSVRHNAPSLVPLAMAGRSVACCPLFFRALLALLLVLAVGAAEGVENRFQPRPPTKSKRGGTQRTSRLMRCASPVAHSEVSDCVYSDPGPSTTASSASPVLGAVLPGGADSLALRRTWLGAVAPLDRLFGAVTISHAPCLPKPPPAAA